MDPQKRPSLIGCFLLFMILPHFSSGGLFPFYFCRRFFLCFYANVNKSEQRRLFAIIVTRQFPRQYSELMEGVVSIIPLTIALLY
jgi:hypothetical protein